MKKVKTAPGGTIRKKVNRLQTYTLEKCNRPDIVVACILDMFSYECFRFECNLVQLHAETWYEQIQNICPHFLFVESAWRGLDESWRGEIAGSECKTDATIGKLVSYCKESGIPTVFWNKEDPPNFQHFIETAKLFDIIFTTDLNSVDRYKQITGNDRVLPLPFGAQPAIHNPVGIRWKERENVAFAGSYYQHRYPERKTDMAILFKPALKYNLHIYNRKKFPFPKSYKNHVVARLDYKDMVKAYRCYRVFLNVNSVKDSPTMFARRVFELLASGTIVISTFSEGIQKMFKDIVMIAKTQEKAKKYLKRFIKRSDLGEKLSLLGIRKVHSKHLCEHRFASILQTLNIPLHAKPGVTVISLVNSPEKLNRLLKNYRRQAWKEKELIILSECVELCDEWKEVCARATDISIVQVPPGTSVGKAVSLALEQSRYDYISLFHSFYYYGPHFITDLMNAFRYTDAHIVGKSSYFQFIKNRSLLLLHHESYQNTYGEPISAHAWILKKEILSRVPLPNNLKGAFPEFLNACSQAGMRMYSTDKFNFVKISPNWNGYQAAIKRGSATLIAQTSKYRKIVTV
ncbi:glycosyltransferase family protein [Paenibacillus xerothermodurans]|uniref:Spore protein YkvP/CgeB glycosyl transferase-like domain-containing protein n=1 Tax=Paenibacillus xerothermodurans TaxID=1977292 RepID=A0A2W1NKY9_PAEXE|nr:glycosyltransferase [Paenibacillus xerothermodurans]PZE20075.1 hypothetical protein CBW46_015460 [Paenibacillus xerothermodurans]